MDACFQFSPNIPKEFLSFHRISKETYNDESWRDENKDITFMMLDNITNPHKCDVSNV